MATTQPSPATSPIGRDTPRIDGPRKVTGLAKYTSDFMFPGMLYAVPVEATIANGKLLTLDTAAAEKIPGLRAVLHRGNIGKIFRSTPAPGFDRVCEERRPPFEDDVIHYYGQYIALAVADTFEDAKAAADAVRATYAKETPNVEAHLEAGNDPPVILSTYGPVERVQSKRGDAEGAFASAPLKLDETYVTPAETHNPLELHATTAMWDGDSLTLYDSTQGVVNARSVLAQMFGLAQENVRVISKFLGSGFGQCPGTDVRPCKRERACHFEVSGIRIRREALSLDARSARCRGGSAIGQAREVGCQPQDDVSVGRAPGAYSTACSARRKQ